jgi:hypothetical protein
MGYSTPEDFAIIDLDDLAEKHPKLNAIHKRNLANLQSYYFHTCEEYGCDSLDDYHWSKISYTDIVSYHMDLARARNKIKNQPSLVTFDESYVPPPMTPSTPNATPRTDWNNSPNMVSGYQTPHRSLRDAVKKDPTIYSEFKQEKHYDTWITSVQAYASLHGTLQVLDHAYIPSTPEEKYHFDDQQAFMWSVVITKVQTGNGKQYMRQNPGNAQKIFHLLHLEHRESLKAEYGAEDLREKLDKFDLSTWTGTYVSFIEDWERNLHLYDELTANQGEHTGIVALTEMEKKRMLKKAVNSSAALKKLTTDENYIKP